MTKRSEVDRPKFRDLEMKEPVKMTSVKNNCFKYILPGKKN